MAGTVQLKKRLRSVRLSGQLASAMKTVASAKFAKASKRKNAAERRDCELRALLDLCGGTLSVKEDTVTPGKKCYLVLGHNRGLCGGYNAGLHAFAEKILKKDPEAVTVVCGKAAIAFFETKCLPITHRILLPDVPEFEDCRPLADLITSLLTGGEIGTVTVIYQKYVNTLMQTPVAELLFPMTCGKPEASGLLMIPDPATVMEGLRARAEVFALYRIVLEAATGAQAATLMAMRTAYDNAVSTAEKLENEINKKRQSAVTAGVIETSAGNLNEGEENNGGWR